MLVTYFPVFRSLRDDAAEAGALLLLAPTTAVARVDRWSALREAASGLTRATTAKEIEALRSKCAALFDSLSLIEPYWAFPGMAALDKPFVLPPETPIGTSLDLMAASARMTTTPRVGGGGGTP